MNIRMRGAAVALGALPFVGAAAVEASDAPVSVSAPVTAETASRVYERFKSLSGEWKGESTKGWTETIRIQTIAQGSAVMETSFEAHPNETMVTMVHPDGERLLLTHYCVAKNQPRLVLTSATPDLAEVVFEFLDGTNLPSRDRGHMDKVVFRFAEDGNFSSQWTWYQDGKESWMEDIRYVRAESAPAAAP
jgi:hypothetical protein